VREGAGVRPVPRSGPAGAGARAAGVAEIDTLPDGRLGVGGVDAARVGDVALAAGVAVHGLVESGWTWSRCSCSSCPGAAMTPLVPVLRSEWRRVASTRLWWGLLIPVVALALLVNLFGGLLGDELGGTQPTCRCCPRPSPSR
jgi:hypothetical protein